MPCVAAVQIATLQLRLERMGRMEASMAAARRSNDDSASATRRRRAGLAIAVGAVGCGALAGWLIVSRSHYLTRASNVVASS